MPRPSLSRWVRARTAQAYLLEVRAEHLARYPQVACLSFDFMAAPINVYGRFDMEELDFLLTRLAGHIAGRTVCDIGANIGNHSLAFAEAAGRVVALEPNPVAFELLRFNCRDTPNVEPLRLGASDRTGTRAMTSLPTNLGQGRITGNSAEAGGIAVDVAPLDELEALKGGDVGLVKIDVEGHEEQVLRGAEALLRSQHPLVLIEQHSDVIADGTSPSVELLRSYGYDHLYAVEAYPRWRSPQSLPRQLRRIVRACEAVLLGPPPRLAEAVAVDRLEKRSYPLLIASAGPVDFGEVGAG